jgi:hypothetical protein
MSEKIKISTKINLLYAKSGYMNRYGTDVWAAALICLAFIIFINYYYFVNILQVVKADWSVHRCNPLVLPFAGYIQNPTDVSKLEFTASNFNDCLNTILKNVVLMAIQPLNFAMTVIQDAVNRVIEGFDQLRKLTANVRNQFESIMQQIYAAMSNLIGTMILYTIKIKDSMFKIKGILTTALFTLFGSYMALVSLFLVIIDLVILILIIIAAMIVAFLLLSLIPLIGIPFKISAALTTLVMIAILVPCLLFAFALSRVMGLSTPPPPRIPGCFAGDTLVEMTSASDEQRDVRKKMKDIAVGDQLKNGSIVTSIIQFAAAEQNVYQLYGTLVTGEHRVFHPTLKWIKVKDHPESVYVPDFKEPLVYCLNTTLKSFTIRDTVFSDWDDIDEEACEDLHTYGVVPGYLPPNFTLADIHLYLESGFQKNSTVVLANNTTIPLTAVKVNDVLATGEKIVGVIKMSARDIMLYNYTFTKAEPEKVIKICFCGSQNIHIADENLGIINGMQVKNKIPLINPSEEFLYHFLTDSKFVTINNVRFNDYNSGIDKYLRQFN